MTEEFSKMMREVEAVLHKYTKILDPLSVEMNIARAMQEFVAFFIEHRPPRFRHDEHPRHGGPGTD